jgi:hypothetical protein
LEGTKTIDMKRRTIIILVILLILVTGGLYAYKKYMEKHPDYANKKPDYTLTASELIAAFDKDTAAARKMYIDKIIRVSGHVMSADSTGSIELGEEGNPSSVTLSLDDVWHKKDYDKIKVGTETVLQGLCSGYQKSKADPDDLLAGLGTTVELRSVGVKEKK